MTITPIKASLRTGANTIFWNFGNWTSPSIGAHRKIFTQYLDHENLIL